MTKETAALEADMEATRERLAGTIDQLVYRASPKTIVKREVASIKGYSRCSTTGFWSRSTRRAVNDVPQGAS